MSYALELALSICVLIVVIGAVNFIGQKLAEWLTIAVLSAWRKYKR